MKRKWAVTTLFLLMVGRVYAAWQRSNPWPTNQDLKAVEWLDANNGFVGGERGEAFKTTDGGSTFSKVTLPLTSNDWVRDIQFPVDSTTGYLIANPGGTFKTTDGGATWTNLSNGPAGDNLSFVNNSVGFAVAVGTSNVYKTTDGGATWSFTFTQLGTMNQDVVFLDANTGYVSANGGKLYKSTDGGQNWALQTTNTTNTLRAISFFDVNTGIAVGDSGTVIYTTDGGSTWNVGNAGTTNPLFDVQMVSATVAFATGTNRTFLKTTDGGATWTSLNTGLSTLCCVKLSMVDANTGGVVGLGGDFYKTTDGGSNWTYLLQGTKVNMHAVFFPLDSQTGFAVGDLATIGKTTDGGATWTFTANVLGLNTPLNDIVFPLDDKVGFAVGDSGVILRTTDGGTTWTQLTSNTTKNLYRVSFPLDAQTGYVGGQGVLLKTTDGGATWTTQAASSAFVDMQAFSATSLGWVDAGNIYFLSNDSGGSWTTNFIVPGPTQLAFALHFPVNPITGYIVADGTTVNDTVQVFKTIDGGTTWTGTSIGLQGAGSNRFLDIFFPFDEVSGYIAGKSGRIYKTSDSGASWTADNLITGFAEDLESVNAAEDGQNLYVAGATGAIYYNNAILPAFTRPGTVTLSATEGDGSVSLSWTASSAGTYPLSEYDVYRHTGDGIWLEVAQLNSTTTTFNDTNVTNGTTYTYMVKAKDNKSNHSLLSNLLQATPFAPPSAPTSLSATAGNNQVALSWTASSQGTYPLSGYNVYRGTSSGGPYNKINGSLVATTSYTDTTAANGTTYYYVVRGVDNQNHESGNSNESSATPSNNDTTPPSAVTVSDGTGSDIDVQTSTSSLSANWTASSDPESGIARYWYCIGTTSGGCELVGWTDNGIATSVTKSGLTLSSGTTYYTSVKAENGVGLQSTVAPSDGVLVDAAPPVAGSVNDGTGADIDVQTDSTSLSANWSGFSDAESGIALYEWAIGTTSGGTDVLNWTGIGTSTSATKSGLTLSSGTTYYVSVRATDGAGNVSAVATSDGVLVDSTPPSAPQGVSASAGDGKVDLSWSANTESDLAGYSVYRATTSGGPYSKLTTTLLTTTSFTDTTVTNGTTYYYVITASDNAGNESGNSAEATATPFAPPNPPTNVSATGGDGQVALSWTAPTQTTYAIASYNIYRATTSGGPYSKINTTALTSTSFTDTSVTNGTTYYYVVTSVDSQNHESGNSAEISATPSTSPQPPTSVTITEGDSTLALSWTGATGGTFGIASYNIYRSTTSGSGFAKIASPTTASYNDTTVQNGTAYYYKITTVDNQSRESSFSQEASGTPFAPPNLPTGVSATGGDGQVALSWTAPAQTTYAIASYNIYRATTSGGPYSKINTTAITTTSFTDTSVTNGTTYYYVVTSVDSQNHESGNSTEASATPQDSTPTSAPQGVSASAGDGKVTLSWSANTESDLAGYSVYRATTTGGPYTKLTTILLTTTSYTDTTVTNGTTYYYVITASDNAGNESGNSAEATATPFAPPNPPTGVSATGGDGQVALSWTAPAQTTYAIASYNIYRATTSGGPYSKINTTAITTTSFTDTSVTNGTTYYYVVTSVDSQNHESGNSTEASATPKAAQDTTPPVLPQGVIASAGDGKVDLSWSANTESDLAGYSVYRGTASGGPYTKITSSLLTTPSYTDTSVTNGTTYYYVITASDTVGNESGNSAEVSARPGSSVTLTLPAGLSMVALPISPYNTDPSALFGTTSFQWAKWNGTAYVIQGTDPNNPLLQLKAGEGYWVKLSSSFSTQLLGSSVDTSQDFVIPFTTGWNQIGNPFPFAVNWSQVKVRQQGVTKTLQEAADAGWIGNYALSFPDETQGLQLVHPNISSAGKTLDPFIGYWIKAGQDGELLIPPVASAKQKSQAYAPHDFLLTAATKDGKQTLYLAPDGKERVAFPPALGEEKLLFYLAEGEEALLASSIQEEPMLFLQAKRGERVTLSLSQPVPAGTHVYLRDEKGKEIDLSVQPYHFLATGEEQNFVLEVLPFEKALLSMPLQAEYVYLFPNPVGRGRTLTVMAKFSMGAPAHATLSLYEATGRKITEEDADLTFLEKGKFKLSFPSLSSTLSRLPNGVYYALIQFQNESRQPFRKVLKVVILR